MDKGINLQCAGRKNEGIIETAFTESPDAKIIH